MKINCLVLFEPRDSQTFILCLQNCLFVFAFLFFLIKIKFLSPLKWFRLTKFPVTSFPGSVFVLKPTLFTFFLSCEFMFELLKVLIKYIFQYLMCKQVVKEFPPMYKQFLQYIRTWLTSLRSLTLYNHTYIYYLSFIEPAKLIAERLNSN